MEAESPVAFSMRSFLLRSWIWNLMITCTFLVVMIIVRKNYADTSATRTDFLLNLGCVLLCWVHTVLILIFSMRRYSRKEKIPGTLFLAHFFGSAILGYYLFVILSVFGWAYTMKGH